jgi:hypothetical protein
MVAHCAVAGEAVATSSRIESSAGLIGSKVDR